MKGVLIINDGSPIHIEATNLSALVAEAKAVVEKHIPFYKFVVTRTAVFFNVIQFHSNNADGAIMAELLVKGDHDDF